MTMRKYFAKSRTNGTCRQCGQTIDKGEPAWWSQRQGWQCTQCKASPIANSPTKGLPKTQAKARGELQTTGGVSSAYVTRGGARTEIEFDRFADAMASAAAMGNGFLNDSQDVDSYLSAYSGSDYFNHHRIDEMLELIKSGSAKATRLVEQMREQIANDISLPTTNRRRLKRGRDFGDEIQADRYLDRIPEMWERMEMESTPAKRATIAINLSVSSQQTQHHLGYRAAAAIALADALTQRGVSVEIRAMKCTRRPTDQVPESVTTIVIKRSDQPMSIPDLAIACCDIGVARLGMIFGSLRYLPGNSSPGLGTPIMIPEDIRTADFIADRDIDSRSKAVQWAQKALSQFADQ